MQGLGGSVSVGTGVKEPLDLQGVFIGTIFVQGVFAGLMIGKFSEGTLKQGLIHSLIMLGNIRILLIIHLKLTPPRQMRHRSQFHIHL